MSPLWKAAMFAADGRSRTRSVAAPGRRHRERLGHHGHRFADNLPAGQRLFQIGNEALGVHLIHEQIAKSASPAYVARQPVSWLA